MKEGAQVNFYYINWDQPIEQSGPDMYGFDSNTGIALMQNADIYTRLTPIFRETFDLDDLVLHPEMTADDVPEWDSLSHIRLVVAVEMGFGIRLNASQAAELENVGQFVALIESLLKR